MMNLRNSLAVGVYACLCICACELLQHSASAQESSSASVPAPTAAATATASANATASEEGGFASLKVWLVSFIAILVISLVGLLSVAIVPLVQTQYYNHFIQYLVALAVGSLTGDAMLHLLPHAIVKSAMEDAHAERCHDEKQTVFKGLVALGGVYFFFMAEKIVALVTEYRTEQKAIEEHQQRHPGEPDSEKSVEKQKRRLSLLYGAKSCDDIMTTGLGSKALRSIDNFKNQECNESDDEDQHQLLHCNRAAPSPIAEEFDSQRLDLPEGAASNSSAAAAAAEAAADAAEPTNSPGDIRLVVPTGKAVTADHNHGHGHGHGHGHDMPQSLASVAWMVIFGDGLHNFTDGLAIGAAFAQSITGGISTSIAVFCHELPHEMGDFAVLLKTGMKVKQALLYNILSSILAAVGMAIGICLGNVTSASYWIFAITGGIFIYISLVDMLPELNLINIKPGESRIAHFILQNAGIVTGVSIMFLIAMFEGEIKGMLGDKEHRVEGPVTAC